MSSIASRRILKDLKTLENEDSDYFRAEPSQDNIFYWKGYIMPPEDTLYFGMILPFEIFFEEGYPKKAPKVKFPPNGIFHPNFYIDGNICVDMLQDKWTPQYDVKSIILSIVLLLREPNPDSPANAAAAKMFVHSFDEFKMKVRENVERSWKHSPF